MSKLSFSSAFKSDRLLGYRLKTGLLSLHCEIVDVEDLFEKGPDSPMAHAPLAARMRPRSLDEYVGQRHILGDGKLLRRAIESDRLTSFILYGPPGVANTNLSQAIA